MPAPLSPDLRRRVVGAYKPGTSYEAIAEKFSVGRASVSRWLAKMRQSGSVEPKAHGGGQALRIDKQGEQLLQDIVGNEPDLNPIELAWSKVKAILRKLKPRALTHLVDATEQALRAITESDLANWFRHAGYAA